MVIDKVVGQGVATFRFVKMMMMMMFKYLDT